jgi:Fe-S cluster assembly protein SufD
MIKEQTKKDILLDSLNVLSFDNEPQFVKDMRSNANKALENLEFPTTKTEYWKYTRIGKITNKSYGIQDEISNTQLDISNYLIPELDADIVVLVNGFFRADLSKIKSTDGIKISALREAIHQSNSNVKSYLGEIADSEKELFIALNTSCFTDGVFIEIGKNKGIEKPIHILNITNSNNLISNTRTLVKANDSSSVKIIESFVNLQGEESFTNNVSEFFLNPNSSVEYNKIQNKEGESYQISSEQVHQEKDSNFTINTVILKGTLVRNNLNIEVHGEGCETNLNGIYLGEGKNHMDNHTVVDHLKPNCNSNEVYKGILDDKSVGVFNGKVFVRQDAQKTNAFQQNNNILLTDDAVVNSKPELEIYADDVKCSHGSTIGQFDDEAVFYLRARGVSKRSAINMMINAFVKDALDRVGISELKDYLNQKIDTRFGT